MRNINRFSDRLIRSVTRYRAGLRLRATSSGVPEQPAALQDANRRGAIFGTLVAPLGRG